MRTDLVPPPLDAYSSLEVRMVDYSSEKTCLQHIRTYCITCLIQLLLRPIALEVIIIMHRTIVIHTPHTHTTCTLNTHTHTHTSVRYIGRCNNDRSIVFLGKRNMSTINTLRFDVSVCVCLSVSDGSGMFVGRD